MKVLAISSSWAMPRSISGGARGPRLNAAELLTGVVGVTQVDDDVDRGLPKVNPVENSESAIATPEPTNQPTTQTTLHWVRWLRYLLKD